MPRKKPKSRRHLPALLAYEHPVSGQRQYLVPLWILAIFFLAIILYFFSTYERDLIIKFFGSSLNYFLPIFYIFIIISYFIFTAAYKTS